MPWRSTHCFIRIDAFARVQACPTSNTSPSKRGGPIMTRQSYEKELWCRAEVLARCCARGLQEAYIMDDSGLQPCTQAWAASMVTVFEGHSACCEMSHTLRSTVCEKAALVVPLLGLYFDGLVSSSNSSSSSSAATFWGNSEEMIDRGSELRHGGSGDSGNWSPGTRFFHDVVLPRKDLIFPSHYWYSDCSSKNSRGRKLPLFIGCPR
mmetsp:Transcript_82470/g.172705  ORF Transcript_82470/g.172705 Transcript_82470/m.172705 type:complete len:208 (+) Transcript_82470:278-901(+)